ncbi:hypothetical protein J4457_03765 [Candidatus Woesearchaeota archaeon]|nr:hypothetical protein [Candidatus Woesearchaeota archaeon]
MERKDVQQGIAGASFEQVFAAFSEKTKVDLRTELDEHLEAINENTNEIQGNFEYLNELDKKVQRLSEKMDEIILLLKGTKEKKSFDVKPLTKREKQVFQALYTILQECPEGVTYSLLSSKLSMSAGLTTNFVTNLIEKGVPVQKCYRNGVVYLLLDKDFADLQARENILGINSLLSAWIR